MYLRGLRKEREFTIDLARWFVSLFACLCNNVAAEEYRGFILFFNMAAMYAFILR